MKRVFLFFILALLLAACKNEKINADNIDTVKKRKREISK